MTQPSPPRPLLIASNRLPVSLSIDDGGSWSATPSSGGLATALGGIEGERLWFGWPGCAVPDHLQEPITEDLAQHGLVPVFLAQSEERLYYRGLSNTVLWPLFHYFTGRVEYSDEEWDAYVEVNDRFARTLAEQAPPDARVWIHDFHLMLVPARLRALRPDLEIGFFLHIPFPSSEIYRLLPRREELLLGLLGADHIGFHTSDYARHFRSTCVRVLGLDVDADSLHFESRRVGLGVHPIGIDTDGFRSIVGTPRTAELFDELRERYGKRKMILGVERLDYTKGVLMKLRAFERYLARDPRRADEAVLLQILVPSRLNHPEYQGLKSEIEETIGRINGTFGRPGINPIDYMHRSLEPSELVALYRLAAAGLVTPVRDGMNLVAQEFVACQAADHPTLPSNHGILILSEFAGAAHSLSRSLLVNPWNLEQVADAIEDALEMDAAERETRMASMADVVESMKSSTWAEEFVATMANSASQNARSSSAHPMEEQDKQDLANAFAQANQRLLFLDYDGTLQEIVARPEQAAPNQEIMTLLEDLAALEGTEVHLVSGRPRENLEGWFGDLPIHLSAEHGFARRPAGGQWRDETDAVDLSWIPRVRELFEDVSREVHGSFVEVKRCAVGWHYRMADAEYGSWRARELRSQLEDNLSGLPVEVLPGRKILEVRTQGIHKGQYVAAQAAAHPRALMLCIGDDRTDQDMYHELGGSAWTIHVGGSTEGARFRVGTPREVRRLLRDLIGAAGAGVCP